MAEALGVAAGAAGLVSFLIQIDRGIEELRKARQRAQGAPAELDSLARDLQFLAGLMQRLVEQRPAGDGVALQHCQHSCDEVVGRLDLLRKKLDDHASLQWPRRQLVRTNSFRQWDKDVKELCNSIQRAKTNLLIVSTFRTSAYLDEFSAVSAFPRMIGNAGPQIARLPPDTSFHGQTDAMSDDQGKLVPSSRRTQASRQLRQLGAARHDCQARPCSCSCHHTVRAGGLFWALEYSPLSTLMRKCDNKRCNGTKYLFKLRMALAQLGLRWATMVQLYVQTTPGRVLFGPSFQVERIMPSDSRGFDLIQRFTRGELSLEIVKHGLLEIAYSTPTLTYHTNPAGRTYLEELLFHDRSVFRIKAAFDLVKFLCMDLGLINRSNPSRLLQYCAMVDPETARPREVLDFFLESGLEVSQINITDSHIWLDSWRRDFNEYEDFHSDILQRLCAESPGFADMTPLHEELLSGASDAAIEYWLHRAERDVKNSFGQTPLHLAVQHPKHLAALIRSGHDIHAVDTYGNTPLEYAAAWGQEASLIILLEAGANWRPRSADLPSWSFLKNAMIGHRWSIIPGVLDCLDRLERHQDDMKSMRKEVTARLLQDLDPSKLYTGTDPELGVPICRLLLSRWGSKDLGFTRSPSQDESSLLEIITSVEQLELLVEHDFDIVGYTNNRGHNGLTIIPRNFSNGVPSLDLLERLLDIGLEINHQDDWGHTPLHFFISEAHVGYGSDSFECVSMLIRRGANPLIRDNCRCACSPNGCFAKYPTPRNPHFFCSEMTFLPALHNLTFLHMLEDYVSEDAAKQLILSHIRRIKHDDLGITHVCCCRSHINFGFEARSNCKPLDEADINDILEEEADFSAILDQEMEFFAKKKYIELLEYWIITGRQVIERMTGEARLALSEEPQGPADGFECREITGPLEAISTAQTCIARYVLSMYQGEHQLASGRPVSKEQLEERCGRVRRRLHMLLDLLEPEHGPIFQRCHNLWEAQGTGLLDAARGVTGEFSYLKPA